ncbi:hypothetical protein [Cryobacterium soli]|uniref:hypothetical protein n=1 Tax=Cryobacterium soli TaxID=2220095 RepID=UPI000E738F46|nr:hypothetical protein [Cryobacterium soli]
MIPTEDAPCARGCTWPAASEDEAPLPKPAKHGFLCNSDFYRLTAALKLVPDLMANMRAQLFSMGAADYSERVSGGGGEAPAPLNLGPLDASDALFARLALWTDLFNEEFGVTMWPPIPSWANGKEVQGSRSVSVETATRQAAQMVNWLLSWLERILATNHAVTFYLDMVEGLDEDTRGIFSLAAQYGITARPTAPADMRECPDCGAHAVFILMPSKFADEYSVICGVCAWKAEPDEHAKYTGRVGYAAVEASRGGPCAVCPDPIQVGMLINRIDGVTVHDGCEGDMTITVRAGRRDVTDPMDRFWTLDQSAQHLNVTRATVEKYVRQGLPLHFPLMEGGFVDRDELLAVYRGGKKRARATRLTKSSA